MFKNKKMKLTLAPPALSLAIMPVLVNVSFKSNKQENNIDQNINPNQDVVQNKLPLNLDYDLAQNQDVLQLTGSLIDGFENINHQAKDNRFQIGSQTKMFTALAIFKLLENNPKFLIDTTMNEIFDQVYIDKFNKINNETGSVNFIDITINDLLSHKAGLPDYVDIGVDGETDKNIIPKLLAFGDDRLQKTDIDDVISIIMENTNGTRPAKGNQSYSNTAYYILGDIIAKISGKSYCDYISENIFDVLGMKNTSFNYDDLDPWFQNIQTNKVSFSFYYSAGGIASSISDMLLWGDALRIKNNQLMTNKSYDVWFKLARNAGDFGAGIYYENSSLTHAGQTLGYLSQTLIEGNNVYASAINNADTDHFDPKDLIDNLINN